ETNTVPQDSPGGLVPAVSVAETVYQPLVRVGNTQICLCQRYNPGLCIDAPVALLAAAVLEVFAAVADPAALVSLVAALVFEVFAAVAEFAALVALVTAFVALVAAAVLDELAAPLDEALDIKRAKLVGSVRDLHVETGEEAVNQQRLETLDLSPDVDTRRGPQACKSPLGTRILARDVCHDDVRADVQLRKEPVVDARDVTDLEVNSLLVDDNPACCILHHQIHIAPVKLEQGQAVGEPDA
nr:hypothetical protein [Tanacetum cinerariifolium]